MIAKIAPSVLSADFLHLGNDILNINASRADYIHLDIMDGHLVPNISFGFPVVRSIAAVSEKPLDAHLMVESPSEWFDVLESYGVKMISFHLEAAGHSTGALIKELHRRNIQAGIAIDPDVNVKKLFRYIGKADFFVVMSVFAGFGGQKFIYDSFDRISKLKAEISKRGAKTMIEVDGGVTLENAAAIKEAGADILVAGNTVFSCPEPIIMINKLREA